MTGIRTEHSDSILSLIFDRTDKKNAITDAMYGALADALVAAESRTDVRVVLFRADGDSFTAGNDLADFARAGSQPVEPGRQQNVERFLEALARCSRPVVAARRWGSAPAASPRRLSRNRPSASLAAGSSPSTSTARW